LGPGRESGASPVVLSVGQSVRSLLIYGLHDRCPASSQHGGRLMDSNRPPRNPRGRGVHGPSDAVLHPITPNCTPEVRARRTAFSSPSTIPEGKGSPPERHPADLLHADSLPTGVHLVPPTLQAAPDRVYSKKPLRILNQCTEPDRFLTEEEASHVLGLSRKMLQAYRQDRKGGPAYHVLGTKRGIRYRLHELFRWAMAREVRMR